jgi:hypothetical protein
VVESALKGEKMDKIQCFLVCPSIIAAIFLFGCASADKPVRKLTKPVDKTAEELVKVRELKDDGETRAILSPADERQLKIRF